MLFPAAGPLSFIILNNSCRITWVSALPGIAPTWSSSQQGNTWTSLGHIRDLSDVLKDTQNLCGVVKGSSIRSASQWVLNPS